MAAIKAAHKCGEKGAHSDACESARYGAETMAGDKEIEPKQDLDSLLRDNALLSRAETKIASAEDSSFTLGDIMVAIQSVKTAMETKIDSTASEVTLVRSDLQNMGTRMKEAEETTAALKTDMKEIQAQIRDLQATAKNMTLWLENYEARSRRINI
ncbi:hypothetical protein NDU88_003727 [Pleurodeles waltl]|uniref:Uncharacterized protein n=1 Tax=Pleurodeles waltl TaxID=8319 RepID=A0AAV7WTU2_PLEWA|nr:hypothetical protein NDU88_003727 [Pleurodeles waltl]